MTGKQVTDPESWIDEYGDALFRYALFRLRNPETAEDAVQETFLAALRAREHFSGQSSVRTWLFGILKHKIVDHIRRARREHTFDNSLQTLDATENLFDEEGKWKTEPTRWATDPSSVLEQKEFREILEHCLSDLPSRLGNAFSLREMDGLNSEEICKVLNISATNLWVILHRARLHLRRCLEIHWFGLKKGRNY